MSHHTVLGWVLFFWRNMDLENIVTLVFSGFSLILHFAHHIAKFRRSCCKYFAAKRMFKLKPHCAVSSAIEIENFVCGEVLEDC